MQGFDGGAARWHELENALHLFCFYGLFTDQGWMEKDRCLMAQMVRSCCLNLLIINSITCDVPDAKPCKCAGSASTWQSPFSGPATQDSPFGQPAAQQFGDDAQDAPYSSPPREAERCAPPIPVLGLHVSWLVLYSQCSFICRITHFQ